MQYYKSINHQVMKKLSAKEEEIMEFFWEYGPMFIRELSELYPDPKPHYNTVSTFVRILEDNQFLGYKAYGNSHQYFPLISKEGYSLKNVKGFVSKFFDNSSKLLVSALIKDESLSIEELKELIKEIKEKGE